MVSFKNKPKPPNGSSSSSQGAEKYVVVHINSKVVKFNFNMLETIKKLHKIRKNTIPKLFKRQMREMTQDFGAENFRWSCQAMNALKFAFKVYMAQLSEDLNKLDMNLGMSYY